MRISKICITVNEDLPYMSTKEIVFIQFFFNGTGQLSEWGISTPIANYVDGIYKK